MKGENMAEEHNPLHDDRRRPKTIATDIMIGLIIAVLTSITTAGATTYVTTKILETQISVMNTQISKNTSKIERVSEEQQRRTWYVYGRDKYRSKRPGK